MKDNTNFMVRIPSANLDNSGFYKQLFLKQVEKYPWLSVAGLDAPYYTPNGNYIRGVEYAGAGKLITVGTAKYHDVNWVKNAEYAAGKGYAPVYDLQKEWPKAVKALERFANARKPRFNSYSGANSSYYSTSVGGSNVEVYDNFVKIGYTIIPKVATNNTFVKYTPEQTETILKVIITLR